MVAKKWALQSARLCSESMSLPLVLYTVVFPLCSGGPNLSLLFVLVVVVAVLFLVLGCVSAVVGRFVLVLVFVLTCVGMAVVFILLVTGAIPCVVEG